MKDIFLYLVQNQFAKTFFDCAVAGFVSGFGFSLVLSMIGYSAYKTFYLIGKGVD